MRFAQPQMFWLLGVTLPLLIWFLWWAWRRKQSLIRQFVQSRLLAYLTLGVSATLQKLRLFLLVLTVTLLFLTLARPQWGFTWEEVKQRGLDIVVAIDTSRSMLAEDVAPNRLARAKLAAFDLMRLARSDRLALVAFAGTAFLQCPLTLDEEAFRQSVDALDTTIIPQGGTAVSQAIEAALGAFKKDDRDNHRVLVLFTDGEDHEGEEGVLAAAEKASETGVRIFTVGVGTPNGEILRVRDANGVENYVKDDKGNVVKSRLNESLLTRAATIADGFYLHLSGAKTVDVLYERGLAPLPRSEVAAKLMQRFNERYQWPLALAIVLLIIELFIPDRRRSPRTEPPTENAGLKKALAVSLVVLCAVSAGASPASAMKQYRAKQYEDAKVEFERLLQKRPEDARLQYNAGAAAYQAEEFGDALKHFHAAAASKEPSLQQSAAYNLGNSLFRLGETDSDPNRKKAQWEQAVKHYETALKLNPQDADAEFNLDVVQQRLEELKKQQQEQKQSDQNKDQNKDKDKEQKDEQSKSDEQKQQENKDESQEQKQQEEQKNNQDQQSQEQQEQQSNQQKQEQSEERQNQQAQSDGEKESPEAARNAETAEQEGQAFKQGQMTQQQAQQLLEAAKADEKALIFVPQTQKNQRNRVFKDW